MRLTRHLLIPVAVLAASVVAVPAAAAAEIYPVPPSGEWTVDGRGWGHGIGMSQWGAQGAALQGRTYRQILDFYYPGTDHGRDPRIGADHELQIRLEALRNQSSVTVWAPAAATSISFAPLSSAGAPQGSAVTQRTVQGGERVQFRVARSGSTWVVTVRSVDGRTVTEHRIAAPRLQVGGTGSGVAVTGHTSTPTTGTHYRGALRLRADSAGRITVVNHVGVDDYLRGVVPREVSAGWHPQALRAQAVAARSYLLRVERDTKEQCDTTACQVYGGRARVDAHGRQTTALEHSRTNEAVTATAGEVRLWEGRAAFTQYSATNGGYSRAPASASQRARHPFLVAQPDPWTGTAPGDTRTRWTSKLSANRVAQHCPSGGKLRNLRVEERDGNGPLGGRITEVQVDCTTGRASLTSTGTIAFGMFSHWWKPREPQRPAAEFHLNDGWDGTADRVFGFGRPEDVVLVGDWDGDGKDTVLLRRGHEFHYTNDPDGGPADGSFKFGRPGDVVLVGDWDGDGKDTLAVRRGREYHLINTLEGGTADRVVAFGRPEDVILAGDWNGDGRDTLAVRRGKEYHVTNTLGSGRTDVVFRYGRADDVVLVGDWDGDRKDTFAVRRGNRYHVKNSTTGGPADLVRAYGRADDEVLVGDWDGDGQDTLGIRRINR